MGALEIIALAIKVIQLGELAVQGVIGAATAFQEGAAKIKELVAANRNPTPAEYDEINATLDAQVAEFRQLAGLDPDPAAGQG